MQSTHEGDNNESARIEAEGDGCHLRTFVHCGVQHPKPYPNPDSHDDPADPYAHP